MEQRRLGASDLAVSALCLGTDSLGSKIGRDASFELLDFFAERGGTFLDTANFYASWVPGCRGGESETTIGFWMKQRGIRSHMVLATKLGFDYPGSGGGLRAAEIERECEKSLGRLQTGHIDLYYAHRDDFDTPFEETMEAFDRLIRAGKVRAIGASNLSVWRIAEANTVSRLNGWSGYCAVQQRHSYLRPRHGACFDPQIVVNEDLKVYCRWNGLTLIAYSILLGGAYTRPERPIPLHYAGPDADERLRVLREVAGEIGASGSQVIVAWMRQSDPPVLPIIAGSRIGQLEENIAALHIRLTADQMRRLDTAGNPEIAESWLR